jgi:anthranilate phosphoribosyltransferase
VSFAATLEQLLAKTDLAADAVEATFGALLDGQLTPAQIAALAVAMRAKGETPTEIAAAARALRARAQKIAPRVSGPIMDTCGTGGDGASTFNVSTATAIVVAACGVAVAKHGNRAISSRAGSADLIEALGIPIDAPDELLCACIEDVGIAFLFAPRHHSALRHAAVVRKELGVRTIFNLLGPLANPGGATHQLLGLFDDKRRHTFAEVLRLLGTERAWIVHGEPCEGAPRGLDEVSPAGVTRVTELAGGAIAEKLVHPSDAGLEPIAMRELAGGDAADNAKILHALLSGERSGIRTAVVLNSACALVVAGVARDLREGRDRAETAIDRGDARSTLDRWRARMRP